ncbi:DUF5131 family protein [Candidatus Soleaferrea massiliensis]|uniref:DUF5131 family protein n=1 Tax=Candidatus Soleaferrea massiliensis TaxID=1470354 RepID=UPI000693B42A|nr:DUF5131 family protein [Candidatus Soleaferrea massiliensis]
MPVSWNPWHGCHKISPGCLNCYVYRMDERHGKESTLVRKNGDFRLPISRSRSGEYKVPSGETVYTCFTSDFLVRDADSWRGEAWRMMRERSDLYFIFVTKRIDRLEACKPDDWGDGYDNVEICCTVENQDRADFRLPIFRDAPIKHKGIVCEPLLEPIDLRPYLGDWVEQVIAGGESGEEARLCSYNWILDLRRQCMEFDVPFYFKQTGARFLKNGHVYRIARRYQHSQARKAGVDYNPSRIQFTIPRFSKTHKKYEHGTC